MNKHKAEVFYSKMHQSLSQNTGKICCNPIRPLSKVDLKIN